MVWLAVVAGAVVGLMLGDEGELGVVGAFIGWLVARSARQQRQIVVLTKQLDERPAASRASAVAVAVDAPPIEDTVPADLASPDQARAFQTIKTSAITEEPLPPTSVDLPEASALRIDDSLPPPTAPPPRPPSAIVATLRGWLFGGNTIVKAGIGILFVGLAFLAKYASEHVQVAIEWRLAGIAAVALALLVVGWRLRVARPGYAQVLQGGAVAVLYLVLFAAFRFYGVIAAGPTFAAMALIAALSAALAVLQDARSLAVVGALGGFAAPLLVSTGGGNFVALFAYYLVLDLGIAAVAWHRTWRALNLIGFFGTFVVATAWGVLRYRPEDYAASQAFLVAFFAVFVAILLMPARRPAAHAADTPNRIDAMVDGTLLFGLPTIAFVLQWGLVRQWPYAVAASALVMAAFYVALAAWARARMPLAFEAGIGIAVVFLTLVFPFAFDTEATAGAWALEGAGLLWVGLRQSRWLARAAGYVLMLLAGVALADDIGRVATRLADGFTLGALMIAAAALFASLQLHRQRAAASEIESIAGEPALIAWGVAWLLAAARHQIAGLVPGQYEIAAWIVAVSAIAALFVALAVRLRWPLAAWPALAHAPAAALLLLAQAASGDAPLEHGGWWAWPIAIAAHLLVLKAAAPQWRAPFASPAAHALGAVVLAGLLALQFREWSALLGDAGSAWNWLGWGVAPALLLLLLLRPATAARWPVNAEPDAYRQVAAGVVAAGLVLWSLLANAASEGRAAPLPQLPLLNPLDLGIAIALFAVARWAALQKLAAPGGIAWQQIVLGGAAFVWITAMLIRAFHHYGGVPYRLDAWSESLAVQSGLALLWSATALALMWRSAKSTQRAPWLAGAALLAAVVLKLLLVDLSGTGTVTRIVSFIGVGVLMLVIGYVAPLPARRGAPAGDEGTAADAAR